MSFAVALSSTEFSGLLTTTEAAELVRRNERTVRRAISDRRLPAQDEGGHWLVRPEDVLAWDRRTQRRHITHRPQAAAWERAAALLADYGSLSAEELAELAGIHVGNARKHLAILAKQGRAKRLNDGQWVLTDPAAEDQGAA